MLHLTAAAQARLSAPAERVAVVLLDPACSAPTRPDMGRDSLSRAAAAMLEVAREDDVLGHIGHGQLALLLADRSTAEDAIEIANKLRTSLGSAPSGSAGWPVVEVNMADRTQPAHEVLRKHANGSRARLITIPLRGEIDMSNAGSLRQALRSVDDHDGAVVVVDFAQVTFIDCAGLGPLLEAQARLGRRLRLRNVPPRVRRMLVFSGTADALLH